MGKYARIWCRISGGSVERCTGDFFVTSDMID
jgi:hypothetical protein